MENLNIPNKIMVREELEDKQIIEEWLTKQATHKVEIHSTKKGAKLRFVEMAENNAEVTLKNKFEDKNSLLLELSIATKDRNI